MEGYDLQAGCLALVVCAIVVVVFLGIIFAPLYFSESRTLKQIEKHTTCTTDFHFFGKSWVTCDGTSVTLDAWMANQGHDYNINLNNVEVTE